MAKLKRDPITLDDMRQYVQSDDDFRFEMETLQMLDKASETALPGTKTIEHGGTYIDLVTGKSREFDIRLAYVSGSGKDVQLVMACAIECKNLRSNFPLLVSRMPRRKEESYYEVVKSTANSESSVEEIRADFDERHPYLEQTPVGKGVVQVGKPVSADLPDFYALSSDAHDKWSQAIHSSLDLLIAGCSHQLGKNPVVCLTWVLPILVVPDGMLWVQDYGRDGTRSDDPKPADVASVYVGRELVGRDRRANSHSYRISHYEIVTLSHLLQHLEGLRRTTLGTHRQFANRLDLS